LGKKTHPGPGSKESSKKMNPRKSPPRHIIIKMAKIKDKKGTLRHKRKATVKYKRMPIDYQLIFFFFLGEILQAK